MCLLCLCASINSNNDIMKPYFVILILLFAQYGFARTVWEAELPVVDKSDYYNVELSQEFVGAGLKYLKIIDDHDNEIPYFIRSSDPIQEINTFEDFKLKSNITKDSLNIIVIDNDAAESINRFCLVLQKAETRKYVSIRGSNDLKQWYIVKQETELSAFGQQTNESTEMLIFDFPQSNYKYYEINLWSNQNSPMEVHKVGKIRNSGLYGKFTEIASGKFLQNTDEEKMTYISFPEVPHTYYIDKIELIIKNKPDYYRQAVLYNPDSYDNQRFSLSSRKDNIFLVSDFLFTSKTTISIENQNNPPLIIDEIKVYGLCRYACVYLEAGKKYGLHSNKFENIPTVYDIEHFRNEIPVDLPVLQIKNQQNRFVPEEPERELSLIEKPWFLWCVIIVVGGFLLLLCIKMIKEVKG